MSLQCGQSLRAGNRTAHFRLPLCVTAVLAAAASGALMAACYWPLNLHFIAWVALVPWLIVLPRLTAGRAWPYGMVVGLIFYRIGLAWLLPLAGPIGATAIVVLAAWMGLSFRVAKLLMDRFGNASMLWAVPLTFVGQEVLRCEGLTLYRFPFLAWGYSQSHNLWIAQIASIGGVHLLSFLLVAFAAAIACMLRERRRRSYRPAATIGTAVLLLAILAQPRSEAPPENIAAACVQSEAYDYAQYARLTAQALADPLRPTFVVLPEHTITEPADENHSFVRKLAALAREHGAFVCVGSHVRASDRAACNYDNVAMLIGPHGEITAEQAKAVPLPFFEDGNPARSQSTAATPYGPLGLAVCYDVLFTDIPRRLEHLGAQLLLVPVMDPERWPAQERWQHADMAAFRSIELRRYAVRAASSGVSQIIDAAGRVCAQRTKEQGPGIICGHVAFVSERSIYARGGYRFQTFAAIAFLGAIAIFTLRQWATAAAQLRDRIRRRPAAIPVPVLRALTEER